MTTDTDLHQDPYDFGLTDPDQRIFDIRCADPGKKMMCVFFRLSVGVQHTTRCSIKILKNISLKIIFCGVSDPFHFDTDRDPDPDPNPNLNRENTNFIFYFLFFKKIYNQKMTR